MTHLVIVINSDNSISVAGRTVGHVSQKHSETCFYRTHKIGNPLIRWGLGKRITLSKPDKAGWLELQQVLISKNLIKI